MTSGLTQHSSLVLPCCRCCIAKRAGTVQPFCSAVSSQSSKHRYSRSRHGYTCKAVSEPQTESQPDVQIEGIDQNYCDDFVCTSSPAVEQTLRALARDLTRISTWTTGLFSDEVRYKDKLRSSEGIDQYRRKPYLAGAVQNPKVLVTKLRMVSRDTGAIEYRMRGNIAGTAVDVDFEDTFELNLLTGRVLRHTETWDLKRCSPAGKAAFLASRLVWSTRQSAADTKDGGSKVMSSFSSMDESDNQNFTPNPNDPMKFFQQPDNGNKDVIQGALLLAFLYLIYNTFALIENIK